MFEQVIAYCERTDFSYWSEPVNDVTKCRSFVIAAVYCLAADERLFWGVCWRSFLWDDRPLGLNLWHSACHGAGGLGGMCFRSCLFILVYIFAATRGFSGRVGLWWPGS